MKLHCTYKFFILSKNSFKININIIITKKFSQLTKSNNEQEGQGHPLLVHSQRTVSGQHTAYQDWVLVETSF